jgi:hypothetical protein
MTEHDLPHGRRGAAPETPVVPISPERHKARFEELAGTYTRGEFARANEDGTVTNIVTFERHIDPLDRRDMSILTELRHRAAAAGYREAFAPLVVPTGGVASPDTAHRPLTFVQLGYEQVVQPPTGR